MKPKCTIYLNWTGPECGKDAVSRNTWGGFQCLDHHCMPQERSRLGPYDRINARKSAQQKLYLYVAYYMFKWFGLYV